MLRLFTNGACERQQTQDAACAAWSIIIAPGHPLSTSAPLPGPEQTSARAELKAAVVALQMILVPIFITLDNEGVVIFSKQVWLALSLCRIPHRIFTVSLSESQKSVATTGMLAVAKAMRDPETFWTPMSATTATRSTGPQREPMNTKLKLANLRLMQFVRMSTPRRFLLGEKRESNTPLCYRLS